MPEDRESISWPDEVEPAQAGLDPAGIARLECIHRKHGSTLFRVACGGQSLVLRWFPDPAQAVEVPVYELLGRHGVPVLPVHGRTARVLVIEDLDTSAAWRLAAEADVARPETGVAVAEWYRALHAQVCGVSTC